MVVCLNTCNHDSQSTYGPQERAMKEGAMNVDELLGIDRSDPRTQRAKLLHDEISDMIDGLARVRRENRLSQAQVAAEMGVDPSFVSRIESGRQDLHLSTLRRYAWSVGATLRVTVNNHSRERLAPPVSTWTIHSEIPRTWDAELVKH